MKRLFAVATLVLPLAVAGCSHPQPAPYYPPPPPHRPILRPLNKATMMVSRQHAAIFQMERRPIPIATLASATHPFLRR